MNRPDAPPSDGGEIEWTYETGNWVESSPTVADGTVFVGSDDNSVYALDAEDGSQLWEFETGDKLKSSPTVADGTVFVGSRDHSVYALDGGSIDDPAQVSLDRGGINDTSNQVLSTEHLHSMDPYDFEQLVAKIWKNKGYNTKVRQKSRHKGIDIVAQRGGIKEVIQVKRYSDDNKLGSMDVRKYATLYQQTNANQVVLITSGSFTKDALELAGDLGVETINGHELVAEIKQHGDDRPD